jgi:amidophosphoribosyltransferase
VNSPYGICLAHNGNLVNAEELKRLVTQQDHRHLNTNSDSETLLNVFAHELSKPAGNGLKPDQILDAVEALYKRCSGGYAVVAMIIGYGVVAFRDPHGIRPLVLGVRETANGVERMVASESVALDAVGFELERDVLPGEAVFIDKRGFLHSRQSSARRGYTPCIFEFVYFARPDSIIDNLSVYKARMRMGEKLADKILRVRPDHDIDVVIPIPDTSRTAALQVATRLGVKYREGFIKNRYIGRTFIMPEQSARRASVRRKLNAIGLEFNRKNVLLVDDSIVRGTTSQQSSKWRARQAPRKSISRRRRRRFAIRTSTASTCRPPESSSPRAAPSSRCSARSARTGSSTKTSMTSSRPCTTRRPTSTDSTRRASRASTSRAT